MKGKVYLIPTFLGDESTSEQTMPTYNIDVVRRLKFFLVEEIRTARRYLKRMDKAIVIDELSIQQLNKDTKWEEIKPLLSPALEGNDIGIMSEAGCPGIADPGALAVEAAHRMGLQVVPLIGPSSILLAMMASGMNGQNFAFVGYLPVDKGELEKRIRRMEERSAKERQTQIFIETPYRNVKLFEDLTRILRPSTRLCIATDVACPSESIVTRSISEWMKAGTPDFHKKPTIFLFTA